MHLAAPSTSNPKAVNRVLYGILVLNLLVLGIKFWIGFKAGSLSIIADGVHSGVDSLNNIIALAMIAIAAEPPDKDHPYGHSKFETLGALAVVAFLAIASFELIEKSVVRFLHPAALPHIDWLTIEMLALTLVINIGVWLYERRAARKYNSQLLMADAEHTFSDILITISILASTYFILQGYYILDPILGVVIAGVIARSGFMILRKTIPILVDEAWLFPADIEAVLADLPQVRGFSDLRSRQVHDERFLEMSVQFATDSLREAHELSHKIEERIIARYGVAQVTIHVEPE